MFAGAQHQTAQQLQGPALLRIPGGCSNCRSRGAMHDDDLISLSQLVNNVAPGGVYLSAVPVEAEVAHANGSPPLRIRRSKTFQVSCSSASLRISGTSCPCAV